MGCSHRPPAGPRRGPQGYLLRGRATPTARQLAETGTGADQVREITAAGFLTELGRGTHQVLVLACVGGTVQALLHALADVWKGNDRRPVVVTGYVGVVYEKLTDGLLLRHGADVVLANSPYDLRRFRAVYEGYGRTPPPSPSARCRSSAASATGRRPPAPAPTGWCSPYSPPSPAAAPTAPTCWSGPWPTPAGTRTAR